MPFRQRLRSFRDSVTSGLDVIIPSRRAAQPSTSLPDAPGTPGSLLPFAPPVNVNIRSETNIPAAIQTSTSDTGDWVLLHPPALLLTGATGEVTSLLQQGGPSNLGLAHVASNRNTAASTILVRNASKGGWAGLKTLLRVVSQTASVFGPLKAAVEEFAACIDIFEKVGSVRDEFDVLKGELEGLFEDLQQHFSRDVPPTVTASMESLCKSIVKELGHVKRKQDRGSTRRYQKAEEDADDVLACYRRIQGYLQRLSLNANLSIWRIVDEQATDARLDRLCPSLSACYDSRQATELKRGACTPGTRIDVLGQMYTWAYDRVAGSVYWLNGMAGTGKTTIAYSLCKELDTAQNLGASFFCSRLLPECRDVNQIVPSIAYQLARFSRPFRSALSRVLEKERDVHTQLLDIQFEMLVIKPLIEVRDTLPQDLVVVIDALDECDNKRSTSQILEALLTKTLDLPIKFFMTSRPEPEIRDQMSKQCGHRAISRLVLHELDKGMVQGDIETYLRVALEPIEPSESQVSALVERAGILFIYAATVVRYIGYDNFGRDPSSRLEDILSISSSSENHAHREIDDLYTVILKAAMDDPELNARERNDMKQVLNTVLCAREPLTIGTLSGLLALHNIKRVHAALRPLWSVLHVVESSELVTTLHASFPDYMLDPGRSKSYHCDPAMQEQVLTRCCFDRIQNAKPQFNICGLESSYVRDDQVPNLSTRVKKAISTELSYACRYWATHLKRAKESPDLVELLDDFMSARLLLWMEIMNLNKCMDAGIGVIREAEEWCMRQSGCEELTQLTYDAWRFVAAFTSTPVSQSTPHIYISMLPFWPESSPIVNRYAKRTQVPMVPHGSAIAQRQLALLATWPVPGKVNGVAWSSDGTRIASVSGQQILVQDAVTGRVVVGPLQKGSSSVQSIGFSPDNTRIVSGSTSGTIHLWDARGAQMALNPLEGHTKSVTSVTFSPDGTRIVSGSYDKTVRVWDVRSGRTVLGPLKGHTQVVTSVAFSPDNCRIVSGSADKTICIWDVHSGQLVLGPLEGPAHQVMSVAFAPDGTHIAAGFMDGTLYMWDTQNRHVVLGPLEGHTGVVTSIAFSPDGTRIVSGSYDVTIRMWDARNGRMVLGPLVGHRGWVTSVAFSPDGTRIVSGSDDQTIRVWDARSEWAAPSPHESHTQWVRSVAFSPDGTRIVSGSNDKTINVWDARSRWTVLSSLTGHTDSVTSVAFSPKGTHIVSGSADKTIRMWDIQSRRTVLGPLGGHASWVTSVAFSPNGDVIVSGFGDGTLSMWDTQSGQVVLGPLKWHTRWVTSVAISADGTHIVSGSEDNTVCVWDARNGEMKLRPLRGHTGSVTSVAFSPDGTRIISGSEDTTIRMWDVQSGQKVLGPLKGHAKPVTSVAFSPDGACIASGSYDKTIRVWDAQSGKMVEQLEGHTESVTSVAFSPDGARIASGSEDNTICMWDARTKRKMSPALSSRLATPILWHIDTDGWVMDKDTKSKLLVWVPSDLRHLLLHPRHILNTSATKSSVGLNFTDAMIGESWIECYRPV